MGKIKGKNIQKQLEGIPLGQLMTDSSNNTWSISECIGHGGFGLIYLAHEHKDGRNTKNQFIIKMEPNDSGPLFCEKQVYLRALSEKNLTHWSSEHKLSFLGLPRFVALGNHEYDKKKYRFLVMDKFGSDLQARIESLEDYKLPLVDAYRISTDVINALEYLHEHDYVHADIKASNLLQSLKRGYTNRYVLADFGLSFRYIVDGVHKKFCSKPKKSHNGTIEFTSLDAHVGADPSRRGDLQILGFCIVRWITGALPWDTFIAVPTKVADLKKKSMKGLDSFFAECFVNSGSPNGLLEFFQHVGSLEYADKPDYDLLRNCLSNPTFAKTSKVKPLHSSSSSKRAKMDITSLGVDSGTYASSMTTEEYFDLHPSLDLKSYSRLVISPEERFDFQVQVGKSCLNN